MPSDLIDTFPAFEALWCPSSHLDLAAIQAVWERHLQPWPDLLQKQFDEYDTDGMDWHTEACSHVFPYYETRMPAMRQAHANLLEVYGPLWRRAKQTLRLEWEPLVVVYVGIGLGAGWATHFRGWPAVFFGLENIAEEGWTNPETLEGLFAHELGHLAHAYWRQHSGLAPGSGPYWQLYEEGFAQACEQVVRGPESWHMQASNPDWLAWCQGQTAWLAREYLRRVEKGTDLRPFFGSWFDLQGYKQSGYYLGRRVVAQLERRLGWQSTACLEDIDNQVIGSLLELYGPDEV